MQTPRLWREPRERIPLTCSFLIAWINHIVGYLTTSASEFVLQRPIIYAQFEAFAELFSKSDRIPFLEKVARASFFILHKLHVLAGAARAETAHLQFSDSLDELKREISLGLS